MRLDAAIRTATQTPPRRPGTSVASIGSASREIAAYAEIIRVCRLARHGRGMNWSTPPKFCAPGLQVGRFSPAVIIRPLSGSLDLRSEWPHLAGQTHQPKRPFPIASATLGPDPKPTFRRRLSAGSVLGVGEGRRWFRQQCGEYWLQLRSPASPLRCFQSPSTCLASTSLGRHSRSDHL